jgi:hypothetical protein
VAPRALGKVQNDDRVDWREAWALFPGDVAYVWHSSWHIAEVQDSLLAAGLVVRSHLIWAKSQMVIGRGHYHYQHEPCWYAVRKGKTAHWAGDRTQTSVWQIDKNKSSETGHSTQKPVECMRRPIENNSSPGQSRLRARLCGRLPAARGFGDRLAPALHPTRCPARRRPRRTRARYRRWPSLVARGPRYRRLY